MLCRARGVYQQEERSSANEVENLGVVGCNEDERAVGTKNLGVVGCKEDEGKKDYWLKKIGPNKVFLRTVTYLTWHSSYLGVFKFT